MKILHIAYSLDESSAAARIAGTQKDRHEIFFLLGRISKTYWISKCQINPWSSAFLGLFLHVLEIFALKFYRIKKNEIFSLGFIYKVQNLLLKRVIKNKNIEMIHLHWGGYGFFPLAAFANLAIPLVVTAHDYNLFTGGCHIPMECDEYDAKCNACPLSKGKSARAMIKDIRLRQYKYLIKIRPVVATPSTFTKNKIIEAYPFLKIEAVGNTVGEFYGQSELEITSKKNSYLAKRPSLNVVPTIITVGISKTERQNKGQDLLEHLFARLVDAHISFRYISVGQFIEYEGVKIREHFDKINQKNLSKLYSISDLCLVPSRYETFSMVTLESILCGTPVVAFNNSGPIDIISNGHNGFLASAFDEDEFFQSVRHNLNFKFNNLELIFKSTKYLREKYSDLSISRHYDQVYDLAANDFKMAIRN